MTSVSLSSYHPLVKFNDAELIPAPVKPGDSNDTLIAIMANLSAQDFVFDNRLPGVDRFIHNKIELAAYFKCEVPPLSEAMNKLGLEVSNIIAKLAKAPSEVNARLAAPVISGDKESKTDANNLELQAMFTDFGKAASVLREVLNKTDAAIQEALQAMVELFNALNTLHEKLNKLARDKVEKSAVQAFNTALTTAVLSAFKEVSGFTATAIKTSKSIVKTEKMFKEKAEHLTQADKMQLQGKAPAYNIDGKGQHNQSAAEYVTARRKSEAEAIQNKMNISQIKFDRDMAKIQAGKMAVDSITRMIEAEGNKESKLTENEAKDAEFQASVAQRTIEDFKNAMQQNLQFLRGLIDQMRTSQQNLMAK